MRTHATTALWRPEGEGLLNVVPREDAPMPQDTVGVAGSFEDYESAATAVQELEFAGLHGIEISLVSNDADTKHAKRLDETDGDPVVAGAAVGGVLGGSMTALAAFAALVIP